MFQVQAHLGRGIACLGAGLALFAFLFLPWVSLGFLGSYTGIQIAQFATQELVQDRFLSLLWLALFIAVGALILSIGGCLVQETEPWVSTGLVVLGMVALLGIAGTYLYLGQQRFLSFSLTLVLSSGFWFYALSMALVVGGGAIQLGMVLRRLFRAIY